MKKITFPILIMTALFAFTQLGFTQNSVNLKEMQQLADHGNVEAQYNMGVIYDRGINVPKNGSKAVEYYSRSAQQELKMHNSILLLCMMKEY